MKTFYLIDGHAQIFRAYYAPFRSLTSPSGEPTKAVHVFLQMLLGILRDREPHFLAVALDHGDETTKRRQLYPDYKANRDAPPEDLLPQVRRIVQLLNEMEIPVFEREGEEADDLIATIATRLSDQDVELYVVSSDKDLYQLLTDKVKLWDPTKDRVLDPERLLEEFGFRPDQAVEVQTLTGDSTDNVPGIPGIGPKKAAQLIRKYGTAESVVASSAELTPKMRENVLAHAHRIDLTRKLVELDREVDMDFDLESCRVMPVDPGRLRPLLEELGLKRLIETIEEEGAGSVAAAPRTGADRGVARPPRAYHKVDTNELFEAFLQKLRDVQTFAIDTETTGLRSRDCDLVGLSFSWSPGEAWYLPVRSNKGPTLDPERTLEALRPILEDPSYRKCGQNIKFDQVVLRSAGVALRGLHFDSMVASYLLFPDRRNHGMDALAREHLGQATIPITDLIGKGSQQSSMLDVDPDRLTEYACEDADITWQLTEELSRQISSSPVQKLFEEVELPLVSVLADMEFHGVAIDRERLFRIRQELTDRISEIKSEIYRAAGREFTVDSPKQLAQVLFDEQGLPSLKKTKTSRSTDAGVLESLAAQTAHPLPGLILRYRALTKLVGTYVEPLPDLVSPRTGRLHASFHQTVAATGRLSSSDPNIQNIPVRTDQGREIRKAFVPPDGAHVLLTADYSQIELRILAHLSRDPTLLEAFRRNEDVHTFVAAQLYGVSPESVTREQRTRAKAVNFGIIYGQGPFGLSRTLGIPQNEAKEFIARYRDRYPGTARFTSECVARAEQTGQVETMLGRRRPIPEIRSRNRAVRAQGERLAINTVVQGSAADMIKVAMVRIAHRIREERLDLRLIIQVHDELVFEAPRDEVERLAVTVRKEMEEALPLDVPVQVDIAWGENWLEGKGR